ncbi:hypothetical protein MYP_345 [Sporocytophaga myxococcoides]|uniref:Uncharacterized protein n=1 Tax=Sporocytophaga myxococcoides TaxID=153721 RepID=A0A098L9P4_9BACT|nr:hypothetical protein MYP_345 [Sporocytophaga myxococcoides]
MKANTNYLPKGWLFSAIDSAWEAQGEVLICKENKRILLVPLVFIYFTIKVK